MSWKISDKEYQGVIALPAQERYGHFMKKVADWQELWMIGDEGGIATYGDQDGGVLIPVWPHEKYASACCAEEFAGYKPEMVSLDDWMELWIPDIAKDGQGIAVFPLSQNKGIVVTAEQFTNDMNEELEKYG